MIHLLMVAMLSIRIKGTDHAETVNLRKSIQEIETKDAIVCWLKSNYRRTKNVHDLVDRQSMYSKIQNYLRDLGKDPIICTQMGVLVKLVFGKLPYIRMNDDKKKQRDSRTSFYGCLIERSYVD